MWQDSVVLEGMLAAGSEARGQRLAGIVTVVVRVTLVVGNMVVVTVEKVVQGVQDIQEPVVGV